MWFKNLRVYRFTEPFSYEPENLHQSLKKFSFKPCGSLDPMRYGWTPPLGRESESLVHAANGYMMLCAKRQEKVIPSAVVKEALEEKVLEISATEGRHVGRSERDNLKDEIIFSLLPRALTKSSLDFAYIDTHDQLLIINSSSAKKAEELISALREALGSLKIIPLTPINPALNVLTDWVKKAKTPKDFSIGEECELSSAKESRSIRCKNQDLGTEEVGLHIQSGLQVSKLAVSWKDAIHCIVDDQFSFKRIKYDDAIYEKAEDYNAESKAEQFDIDFSIMTLEISAFLKAICRAFGGVETEASQI